jgi:large subunit ribosomal protein L6
MSRVGKNPIAIPDKVKIEINGSEVVVTGPKGKLDFRLASGITAELSDKQLILKRRSNAKRDKSLHGVSRSIVYNMVTGVTDGYQKELEIIGMGFKAQLKGKTLVLQLGRSHLIEYPIPEGIEVQLPKPTTIVVNGIDKAKVGQVAAEIRAFHPPEPYKGKGIRYKGEYVRRKVGKAVA